MGEKGEEKKYFTFIRNNFGEKTNLKKSFIHANENLNTKVEVTKSNDELLLFLLKGEF